MVNDKWLIVNGLYARSQPSFKVLNMRQIDAGVEPPCLAAKTFKIGTSSYAIPQQQ
jgi:hypothetical protein